MNVCPTTTPANVANGVPIDSKHPGHVRLAMTFRQHLLNLNYRIGSQFPNSFSASVSGLSVWLHWKVFPNFTQDNQANVDAANTERLRQLFEGERLVVVTPADTQNISVGQMTAPKSRALTRSIFSPHIIKIIFAGSNEKVRRIAARRIIAAVADQHSGRDRSYHQFISETVGANALPIKFEPSIAHFVSVAAIFQAVSGFLEKCHKSIFRCHTDHLYLVAT